MAEAPPDGLFPAALDRATDGAELDGDQLCLDLDPFGPAGSSAVELPDGSVLEVDHLEPGRLVGARITGVDPASSPLLLALFGGDGALQVVDVARGGRPPARTPEDDDLTAQRIFSRPGPPRLDRAAELVGRLVVLSDLATDPAVDPLARIVAVAELVVGLDSTPGGDLFAPLTPGLAGRANAAAEQVTQDDLVGLNLKRTVRLASVVREVVGLVPSGQDPTPLLELIDRLGQTPHRMPAAASMAAAPDLRHRDEMREEELPAALEEESPGRALPEVVRRAPSLLEVTVPGGDRDRWVRVLRTDGLVALAVAPLHRHGLMARAELLVPPDTDTRDLTVQVLDHGALAPAAEASTDVVRRAVRAGRAAVSSQRNDDWAGARRRWQRCAELWERVGDLRRADEARDHGRRSGGTPLSAPLMADELDPFGIDVHLEEGTPR